MLARLETVFRASEMSVESTRQNSILTLLINNDTVVDKMLKVLYGQ